jgi:hypothetical protein
VPSSGPGAALERARGLDLGLESLGSSREVELVRD